MGRYESPGFAHFQAEQDSLLFNSLPGAAMNLHAAPLADSQQAAGSLALALLAPSAGAAGGHLGSFAQRQLPDYNPWGSSSLDSFDTQLSYEDTSSRQHQGGKVEALYKLGAGQHHAPQNSRLGNLQYSSSGHGHGHGLSLPQHSAFPGKLPGNGGSTHPGVVGFGGMDSFPSDHSCGSGPLQPWDERTNSPYRNTLIGTFRAAQELRDSSASSSPFGSFSGSPRGVLDLRGKRLSGSAAGVSSPRTPPHGAGGHRVGIDPRLVVGSPLEIAWEVLQANPGLAALLGLQPSTASLRNVQVQEDDEPEAPAEGAPTSREPDTALDPEQLMHEQGLVRSCRGLPARVRDDLIKAARLAVTRRDSSGRELPGTGLLPFFWRVQSNLKWLLQQPATLKGQLLPGQIDFITEEQRGLSFQKTVQQRMRLGELAVMLHTMLAAPEEGSKGTTGSSA